MSSWIVLLLGALLGSATAVAQPFAFYRGVLNAASYAPAGLPNGSIARGSIFTIFGRSLGPVEFAQAAAFPLQSALAGVAVEVCQDSACVNALPLYVSAGQINAIMPSNAPLGGVSIRVRFNDQVGNFIPADVAASSVGIFAVNSGGFGPGIVQNFFAPDNQPLNSVVAAAKPGQVLTLWATGLGAGLSPDNVAPQAGDLPVEVEIFVGGKLATNKLYSGRSPCCSGVDQIAFEVPAEVPEGCHVPVQIRTARSVVSNTVTLAIRRDGGPCVDADDPFEQTLARGGRIGVVFLVSHRKLNVEFVPGLFAHHNATALFHQERGGDWFYNGSMSLQPIGSCATASAPGALSEYAAAPDMAPTVRTLDAGTLTITPAGMPSVTMLRAANEPRWYFRHLGGGSVPLDQPLRPSPEFDPARQIRVAGSGGADVGAFEVVVPTPHATVNWTNQAELEIVDRSRDLTVTWDNGAQFDRIVVEGGHSDALTNTRTTFRCIAEPSAGRFTIPGYVLSSLTPSRFRRQESAAWVSLSGLSPSSLVRFSAPGLDAGLAVSYVQVARDLLIR